MTNKNTLHIHKWDTFLSVIFEDAALRVGDSVTCSDRGHGIVMQVFYAGKGETCLIEFKHGQLGLHNRTDLELEENGWVAKSMFHGRNKRVRHDRELRDLMNTGA